MSIVRAVCQPMVLPMAIGVGANASALPGPTNPWPAFEAAQTNYNHGAGGYDGTLPSPAIAAATLEFVTVSENYLLYPLPDFSSCTVLTLFSAGTNTSFAGPVSGAGFPPSLQELTFGNTAVTAFTELSGLTSLSILYGNNSQVTALPDVAALSSLTELDFSVCPLTSWSGTVFPNSLNFVSLSFCDMTSALVDQILVALAAATATNGNVDLTNNSVPGASGLAAKTTLEGRGWTVDVDA